MPKLISNYSDGRPKVLLACSQPQYDWWSRSVFVGRLFTPTLCSGEGGKWLAADNNAFCRWDARRFIKMLHLMKKRGIYAKWVACPDVVGDWKTTLHKFEGWSYLINELGFKSAFVLQDGMEDSLIPWNRIKAVFLGGTDSYKESTSARDVLTYARTVGKLVHIGRVNSIKRLSKFLDIADSFDGLTFSKFSRESLPRLLKWLEVNGRVS